MPGLLPGRAEAPAPDRVGGFRDWGPGAGTACDPLIPVPGGLSGLRPVVRIVGIRARRVRAGGTGLLVA
ncbi:hypothetical protein GCM10010517_01970 [Streptosporangium fragile]|uniref:Uncharacterized protein n=1 Tax=Streptosporangium fragile TaxID=46186 RepID=A0ABN3VPT3_9ACTN